MLDLVYAQEIKRLTNAVREIAASSAASAQILVDNGICTEQEWLAMRVRVSAHIDQQIAAKQEEMEAKVAAMDPIRRMMYEVTGVDLSPEGE